MPKIETTHYIIITWDSLWQCEKVHELTTYIYDDLSDDDLTIELQSCFAHSESIIGYTVYPVGTETEIIDRYYWDIRGQIDGKDYLERMGFNSSPGQDSKLPFVTLRRRKK